MRPLTRASSSPVAAFCGVSPETPAARVDTAPASSAAPMKSRRVRFPLMAEYYDRTGLQQPKKEMRMQTRRQTQRLLTILTRIVVLCLATVATVNAQAWQPPSEKDRCPSRWGASDERG